MTDDGRASAAIVAPLAPHRDSEDPQTSGLGPVALSERVRALNGTFEAGPSGRGWRASAVLPIS